MVSFSVYNTKLVGNYNMRSMALFVAYLALSLVIGAVLAYPLYVTLGRVIDEPMSPFVTRSGMLVALLGIGFFLRYLDLNNKQALGYALPARQFIASMLTGVVFGVIIMLPLAWTLVLLDVRVITPEWVFSWPDFTLEVSAALVSGLLIALNEETFFRGALFSAVSRESGLWPAAVSTALLYAALHFMTTSYEPPAGELAWYSGLAVVAHMFEQFADPVASLDSFLALFAVGIFLAFVRAKTGHIAACVGLHAGWVLVIKLTKDMTSADHAATYSFLIGTYDSVIGYLALLLITPITLVYYLLAVRGRTAS
jgi:membrane protease YdiL (CAAX protease family)